MKFLVPIVFTILIFVFLGVVLYLTKYKRRNETLPPAETGKSCTCCSDSSCCSE